MHTSTWDLGPSVTPSAPWLFVTTVYLALGHVILFINESLRQFIWVPSKEWMTDVMKKRRDIKKRRKKVGREEKAKEGRNERERQPTLSHHHRQ